MSNHRARLAILISGNGSNLQAIIDAVNNRQIDADIAVVLSNRAEAYGLERARKANIPTGVLSGKEFDSREAYDSALKNTLLGYEPDLIILAGFMRLLTPGFVRAFNGKLINIHPSLLPAYKGLDTHQRVLNAKEKFHGVTVHYVTEVLDSGPILGQAQLEILPEDTAETLEARIHQLEHALYPKVIAGLVNNP